MHDNLVSVSSCMDAEFESHIDVLMTSTNGNFIDFEMVVSSYFYLKKWPNKIICRFFGVGQDSF